MSDFYYLLNGDGTNSLSVDGPVFDAVGFTAGLIGESAISASDTINSVIPPALLPGDFTLAAHVYLSEADLAQAQLQFNITLDDGEDSINLDVATLNGDSEIVLQTECGGGETSAAVSVSPGWLHAAMTRSGGLGQFYINGVAVGSTFAAANTEGLGGNGITVFGAQGAYPGLIDMMFFSNEAKPPQFISQLYAGGAGTESVPSQVAFTTRSRIQAQSSIARRHQ